MNQICTASADNGRLKHAEHHGGPKRGGKHDAEIIKLCNQGMCGTEIAKRLKLNRNTILKAMSRLAADGAIKSKKRVKSVRQIKRGKASVVYPSIAAAERATGITSNHISACARGKVKTAGGYKWEYAEG